MTRSLTRAKPRDRKLARMWQWGAVTALGVGLALAGPAASQDLIKSYGYSFWGSVLSGRLQPFQLCEPRCPQGRGNLLVDARHL